MKVDSTMSPPKCGPLRVYSDGASRGNPGPAAIALKIVDANGHVLKRAATFLGRRTNNEAEYEALITALGLAQTFTDDRVECFIDSELVVKQLTGEYRVRNPRLETLWVQVRELQNQFHEVRFHHIPRTDTDIAEVDKLANRVLDQMYR
jgi:ribonuclease HI